MKEYDASDIFDLVDSIEKDVVETFGENSKNVTVENGRYSKNEGRIIFYKEKGANNLKDIKLRKGYLTLVLERLGVGTDDYTLEQYHSKDESADNDVLTLAIKFPEETSINEGKGYWEGEEFDFSGFDFNDEANLIPVEKCIEQLRNLLEVD